MPEYIETDIYKRTQLKLLLEEQAVLSYQQGRDHGGRENAIQVLRKELAETQNASHILGLARAVSILRNKNL